MGMGAALVTRGSFAATSPESTVPRLESFKFALNNQNRKRGCPIEPEQVENLSYAYHAVNPRTFTEMSLVIWAGIQMHSEITVPYINEYCRRRSGAAPQMFDHPVLALENYCVPDTHRVLVFREQFDLLGYKLTKRNIATELFKGKCSSEMFNELLLPTYKESLTKKEKRRLIQYIVSGYGFSRTYTWCATLVEQALANKLIL
jgi:hypothetical protein